MKCEAIYAYSSEHSVRKMCKVLELCESSYYQWLRGEKRRQKRIEKEQSLIETVKRGLVWKSISGYLHQYTKKYTIFAVRYSDL